MFNTFQFNTNPFNAIAENGVQAIADTIIFNNYGLQNADIVTQILLQDSTPERSLETFDVPRGNGSIMTGDFWRKKIVKIEGVIHKTTNALLEAEIDAMKKALAVGESILDVTIAGTVRRYIATLQNGRSLFSARKGFHVTFCPFSAEFLVLEPFGKSVSYNSASFLGIPSLVLNEEINNLGTISAKAVVVLNFTAANGIIAISFKNNTTGEEIKLTSAINAGDYVKFDSEEMEVTQSGIVKDYEGGFTKFATGANSFTVTIAGTSCTYDLTVKHKTNYL